jgi:hypothetical protein
VAVGRDSGRVAVGRDSEPRRAKVKTFTTLAALQRGWRQSAVVG